MIKFFQSLLDLIYRKKCYFCGKSKESVKMCSECYQELNFSEVKPNRIINGVNIYSCGIYEKNLQKLIRGLKYHKQKGLAFYLAKFMNEYFEQINLEGKFQVVPVPLHKNRVKKRKYNHMEIVAEEYCRMSGNILNVNLIKRIKDTKPQYKLSRPERMKNLANAFVVEKENDLMLPVLIIDDICTTGTTFEEMINVLKANGINDIVCLASSSP
ncbi:ComF family protein [bacterium]|nr:ComF family protein [bacterium]